jgi:hypothetical protein
MLRKIHGTTWNFFHIKFLVRSNIKYQNGPATSSSFFNLIIWLYEIINKYNSLWQTTRGPKEEKK